MAFAGMSPGDPDGVGAFAQGRQEKFRTHSAGTWNPDHPDIGRIFHPADTSQIRRPITAPVTEKTDDFGFKLGHYPDSFAETPAADVNVPSVTAAGDSGSKIKLLHSAQISAQISGRCQNLSVEWRRICRKPHRARSPCKARD